MSYRGDMSIKSGKWIRRMAEQTGMIEPLQVFLRAMKCVESHANITGEFGMALPKM